MGARSLISPLFYLAGLYDGLLGLVFLFFALQVFDLFGITPPNHLGYVQFPAALLVVFAGMFYVIARAPLKNRNLIPFGALLKVSYCAIVFYYWLSSGIPGMWKPFAVIDLLFLLLFLWAYKSMGQKTATD